MAVGEQFSLSWNEFHKNLSSGFHSLFEDSSLVDVTLAAEGRKIQAHRVVLSVCSPYFKEMFSGNPCQHPIVFLKDVSFLALKNLLQFMYQGEVNVRQEDLPDFIKTAEQLQVKGLTGGSTKDPTENASNDSTASQSSTWSNTRNVNRVKSTPSPVPSQLTRKQSSIASKRQKNSPSTAIHPAKRPYVEITESSLTQEPEEVNVPSADMIATLKLEPEESYVINSDDPLPDDPKLNDSDFPADAVLQELDDEPQAGTSMMMGDSKDAVTQEFAIIQLKMERFEENLDSDDDEDIYDDFAMKRVDDSEQETSDSDQETFESSSGPYFIGRDMNTIWDKCAPLKKPEHRITCVSGVKSRVKDLRTPLEIWKCFFDDSMINSLVEHANKCMKTISVKYVNDKDVKPTDRGELYALFGLLYLSGIYRANHHTARELWKPDGMGIEMFRLTMSAPRFRLLMKCLSYNESETKEELAHIKNIYDTFVKNCLDCYSVSENVVFDEKVEIFRGKSNFLQSETKEGLKHSVQMYFLTDVQTGYTYNLEIDLKGCTNQPETVVDRLCTPIYGSGRNVIVNARLPNVIEVANKLLDKRGLTIVAPVHKHNTELPINFVSYSNRAVKSTMFGFQENCTLVSHLVKKRKNALFISTKHHDNATDPDNGRPEIVTFYEKSLSKVDAIRALQTRYACDATGVGYRRNRPNIALCAVMNAAAANAWIVRNEIVDGGQRFAYREFLRRLAFDLINDHLRIRALLSKEYGVSLPRTVRNRIREICGMEAEQRPVETRADKRGRCQFCKSSQNRRTRYFCKRCGRFLCLEHVTCLCRDCFEDCY